MLDTPGGTSAEMAAGLYCLGPVNLQELFLVLRVHNLKHEDTLPSPLRESGRANVWGGLEGASALRR